MNPGDRWGRYQIVGPIGRGAMGEVWLARDPESGEQIALKMVYKGPDAEDRDIVNAERVGAELQKRLSGFDRRVVIVQRYGEVNGGDLYIEMEYIDGEDLSTLISRGPLASGFANHVGIELCEMLENLGAFTATIDGQQFAGVVHGDLKPRNVRLNRQNQVKVLDFGIAKALSNTRKQTMNVFASTAYSSPERLETQNIDSHSDLWSVGVLLYQMLSAKLPFDEPTKERLERRIRAAEPPPPLPPGCPDQLGRIVFKMLSRDMSRRYQNATEMKGDLLRFRRSEPVLAEEASMRLAGLDSEMTERTTKPLEKRRDDGTGRGNSGPGKEQPIYWPPKRIHGPRARSIRLAVTGVAIFLAVVFFSLQWNFINDAGALQSDLQTERVSIEDGWNRYQALSGRMHFGVLLWGAERALKKRIISAADNVIMDFRNMDVPSVGEPQWTDSRNKLNLALQLDPNDARVQGRLRLCEAQIDRINGEPRTRPRYRLANRQLLSEALAKFTQAAELLKDWPDPYLGMVRLYASDYASDWQDMEKAEEALKKSAEYGKPAGKREMVTMAEGYKKRGDRFLLKSRTLPDQELYYLNKAHDDYVHAQDLYREVGLFGNAAEDSAATSQLQKDVDNRIRELQLNPPVFVVPPK